VDNVRRAVKSMRVDHPVAIDNDYAIWRAFDNHFWPALYFADAQGRIRHHHFGEGEYQQSEMIIQQLLAEAGSGGISHDLVSVDARGVEAPADWASLTDLDRQGHGTAAEPGSVIGAYLRDHIPRPRRPGLRLYLSVKSGRPGHVIHAHDESGTARVGAGEPLPAFADGPAPTARTCA
jgi:hypothetical protein